MSSDGQPLVETITLGQAKQLIKCLSHSQSLLLLSPPGVGKSDTVVQAARERDMPCRSLLGTQIAPEDVSGIPHIVGERSVFCPPRILLPEKPEPFCLFLDELPACPPDIQKAFYSLLLERRLGEHYLPRGSWVVAAGNRAEDRALVRSISSALVNRVIVLNVRVDVKEWLAWAKSKRIRSETRWYTVVGVAPLGESVVHHLHASGAHAPRAARARAVFDTARLGLAVGSARSGGGGGYFERHDSPRAGLWPGQSRGCGAVLRHGRRTTRRLEADRRLFTQFMPAA